MLFSQKFYILLQTLCTNLISYFRYPPPKLMEVNDLSEFIKFIQLSIVLLTIKMIMNFINNILLKTISKNNDHLMNLRHKKPINSYKGQASYQDQKLFQKQDRRTWKIQNQEPLYPDKVKIHPIQNRKSLSQLLASFINNSNYAFKIHSKKDPSIEENPGPLTNGKRQTSKSRKRSELIESFEQKKIETNIYQGKQKQIFKNVLDKDSKKSSLHYKKNAQNLDNTETSFYQNIKLQNIINQHNNSNIFNYPPTFQQNFNFQLMAHQIPTFLYYNHPFDCGSLQSKSINSPGFTLYDQMRNGLIRQMQIYQLYKRDHHTQPNPNFRQTNTPYQHQASNYKKSFQAAQTDKPEKIMKRASYHVGIAYMIYLDKIKRSGKQIKSIESIDPTKQAKKFKQNHQKKI